MTTTQQTPTVGDDLMVRGVAMTIVKVHPFGTYDVKAPSGRTFRVSGLLDAKAGRI